jgi:hypothetical protein
MIKIFIIYFIFIFSFDGFFCNKNVVDDISIEKISSAENKLLIFDIKYNEAKFPFDIINIPMALNNSDNQDNSNKFDYISIFNMFNKEILNHMLKSINYNELININKLNQNKRKIIYQLKTNNLAGFEKIVGKNSSYFYRFQLGNEKIRLFNNGIINFHIIGTNSLYNNIVFGFILTFFDSVLISSNKYFTNQIVSFLENIKNKINIAAIEDKITEFQNKIKGEDSDENHEYNLKNDIDTKYSNTGIEIEFLLFKDYFYINQINLYFFYHRLFLKKKNIDYKGKQIPDWSQFSFNIDFCNNKIIKQIKYLNKKTSLYQKFLLTMLIAENNINFALGFQRNIFIFLPYLENFLNNFFIFFYYKYDKNFDKNFFSKISLYPSALFNIINSYIILGWSIKFKFMVFNIYWYQGNFIFSFNFNRGPLIMNTQIIHYLTLTMDKNNQFEIFKKELQTQINQSHP